MFSEQVVLLSDFTVPKEGEINLSRIGKGCGEERGTCMT